METAYSKHKECDPSKTVERIRDILTRCGVETEVEWFDNNLSGTFSNRVSVKGLSMGANGKGLTREYALASGYAELMERVENDLPASREYFRYFHKKNGFYHFPDERLMTADECLALPGPYVRQLLEYFGISAGQHCDFLRQISCGPYNRTDGRLPAVEFYDQFKESSVWLPAALVKKIAGSNGMAAGNTLAEAFVQGLSEVFERHVQMSMMRGGLTPPEIPADYLKYIGVWELIGEIEKTGRYKVTPYDCSLGEGYPVVGTMLTDLERGSFGFKFGAHPSFAVALERTLTESFQGKGLDRASAWNAIGSREQVLQAENIELQISKGKGMLPADLFAGEPGWQFSPWKDVENRSNEELRDRMCGFLREKGFSLLFRDSSYLGFPACQILIPGITEIASSPEAWKHDFRREVSTFDAVRHFPDLTDEEEEDLIRVEMEKIKFERLEDPQFMFYKPLARGMMHPHKVLAFLCLKHGYLREAQEFFSRFAEIIVNPTAKLYWNTMAEYARLLDICHSRTEALRIIDLLYPQKISERIKADTDPECMMSRGFLKMNCYNCSECEMGEKGYCQGKGELEVYLKFKAAMKDVKLQQRGI